MQKYLVFTDLDGSLLSHQDYSWEKAAPALHMLEKRGFPVIFNSSKTSAEILKLKHEMNNHHPFVSENGGVIEIPENYFSPGYQPSDTSGYEIYKPGLPYEEIIQLLERFRQTFHYEFIGFHDMSVADIMAETNLSEQQARDAKRRQATEPIIWQDSHVAFYQLKQYLEDNNLIITSGGRFSHVMSQFSKGGAIRFLTRKHQQAEPDTEWFSIGLGDSDNDLEMLEAVDYPVLIPNPGSKHPVKASIPNLIRPVNAGPAGWNQAISGLLEKLQ